MTNDRTARRLEDMSTEQIRAHFQRQQEVANELVEQLITRAAVQEYTERQYDELIILLQEALAFIEGLSSVPVEWVGRRNELIARLKGRL